MELGHDDCRFVMRTRWKDMATFCARKITAPTGSYCNRHRIMCYPVVAAYVKTPFKRRKPK